MSTEDIAVEGGSSDGMAEFKQDLVRIGNVMMNALNQSSDGVSHDELVDSMDAHFDDENVDTSDAIVAAWFFILRHAK